MLYDTQSAIRDMAAQFSQERLWPQAEERDRTSAFPRAVLTEMGELGFLGMLVPEEYGGIELDILTYSSVIEEIAAGDASCAEIVSVHSSVGCGPIVKYGTEAQKQKYLPRLASGEWIGGFALTEPQAGSDASKLQTTAVLDGDEYVINGSKQFISSGKYGHVIIVFAVTDKSLGSKGISAFIVETNTPGYNVVRVEEKLGLNASDTCQLSFDDMRIPKENLLGAEGEGYKIALANLEGGRIGIAAQATGIARKALEVATEYALERKAFGTEIANHQAVAFRLADMATKVEAARQLTRLAAERRNVSLPALKEASMAKLFASEMAEEVCSAAMQTLGGYGYLCDYPVERLYRDVRVCQIYEGTSDIQRLVIAREILSNPRAI